MSFITQIPPILPIRFVPYVDSNTTPNARYNFKHWDGQLFADTPMYWQLKRNYSQKVQLTDRITVMVHTQNNSGTTTVTHPPTLKLYNCATNALVVNLNATTAYIGSQVFAGNIDSQSGQQLDTHLWSARATTLTSGVTGTFQFILETYDSAGNVQDVKISEPISIKTKHENTILLEFNITKNHKEIIIDNWFMSGRPYVPYFGLRFEGDIRQVVSASNLVDYKGISQNQYQLSSRVWETHTLMISGNARVPDYLVIKVAHGICADNFSLDGRGFTYVNENSQSSSGSSSIVKIENTATSLLSRGSVPIRRDTIENSFTTRGSKLLLFTSPGGASPTYPYAFHSLTMRRMFFTAYLLGATVIDSITDVNNAITLLNGASSDVNDLTGTFSYDGATGNWYYLNGTDEGYYTATCNTRTTHLDNTITVGAINTDYSFYYIAGTHVVDFGDGTIIYDAYSGSGYKNITHNYATTGNKILRIFHDDATINLTFNGNVPNAYISQITGSAPRALQTYFNDVADVSSHTNISPAFLDNAGSAGDDGLLSLIMSNCGIKAFSPDLFSVYGFSNLYYIGLDHNQLSVTQVDNIFNNLSNYMYTTSAGYLPRYITTKFQTPSAAPTATSATARAYLAALGYTIVTD